MVLVFHLSLFGCFIPLMAVDCLEEFRNGTLSSHRLRASLSLAAIPLSCSVPVFGTHGCQDAIIE